MGSSAIKGILVIEQDPLRLSYYEKTLQEKGFNVFATMSILSGLHIFQNNRDKIDVVVTETNSPNEDGLTLESILHKDSPDLPLITLTNPRQGKSGFPTSERIIATSYKVNDLLETIESLADR